MFHFFSKYKFHTLAILLCVFMSLSFCIFSFYMPKIVFAVQPTSSPEDTATYFSNNNYTEEEIDRYTIESTEIFYDALSYDGEFLTFDSTSVTPVSNEHNELVRMISANVDAMNELVREGVGYIDENYEFQPTVEDEYLQRYTAYNFKLKWNKASACLDGNFAIASSLFFLISKIYFNGEKFKIENSLDYLTDETFIDSLLETAENECLSLVASITFSTFDLDAIYNIASTMIDFRAILTASNLYLKIINIIIFLLLPSIADCSIVLYNSLFFDRGAKIVGCWIPTRKDRLGVSLSVL